MANKKRKKDDLVRAVVVNDDVLQLELLKAILEDDNIEVKTFERADTALTDMAQESPPDIIITDIFMPDIDGWRFCRLLRSPEYKQFNDVPILVISATFSGEDADSITSDLGANAFMPAPVDAKKFLAQVRALLKGDKLQEQIQLILVEDSKSLSNVLKETFLAHGYSVDQADSIKAATELFRKNSYEIAVIDYHLPDGKGDVLLDTFRRINPKCVIVAITIDPSPELALLSMKKGAAAYIRKPFKPEYLIGVCEKARRERALMRVEELLEKRTVELRESEESVRKKLNTVLKPDGDIEALELKDIIDVPTIQSIMNHFYKFMNVGMSIVDMNGNVLVATGWQDICTKFHRIHPETNKYCIESDVVLSEGVEPGTFKIYKCKNNMWDMVTPIVVGEKHIGNFFLGQFFFDDEKIDYDVFRKQAEKYGFDEEEYIAALDRVPRWNRERVTHLINYYVELAGIIANISFANLALARSLEDKKRTELELRKSEEYNRSIIEVIPDIIFRFNRDGQYLDIIASSDDKLYRPREELLGKLIAEVFPKQEMLHFMKYLNRALDTESLQVVEYRLDIKSTACWFEARIIPAGKNEVIALVRDITERKQAEDTLREREERFQKMLSLIPDMVSIHDPEMNILYSNWRGFADVDAEKRILNTKCYRTYRGYDNICPDCEAKNVLLSRKNIQKEVELPDGTWIDLRVLPMLDKHGNVEFFMEWVRDMTERKRAENEIRKAEHEKSLILDNTIEIMAFHDRDHRLIWCNSSYLKAVSKVVGFQVGIEEIKEKKCYELWGLDRVCSNCPVSLTIQTGMPQEDDLTPQNQPHWPHTQGSWMIRAAPVRGPSGVIIGAIEIAIEITERRQIEESLRQSHKMQALGTLAGGIAHEFNNILAGIMGCAEIIKDNITQDNPAYRFIESLFKEGDRAVRLIKQIGIFSKSKKTSLEPLKIAEVVQESVSFIRSTLSRNIIINENISCYESIVMASPELIEQLIINLCSNSAYAMEDKGGVIEVELERVETDGNNYASYPEPGLKNYVSLKVSDTGTGFDPALKERIFEPFFTTKPVGSGTGMGLAMVNSIVEELKGSIRVETEEGKGSVFEVLLPEGRR